MKGMILAAGLGTRLRPLTNDRPKALVEINGRTLLELTIARLKSFGVNEIIVNVHHFANQVVAYLQQHNAFGIRIEISREDDLVLDTGGGLKKAAWFFREDAAHQNEPFIVHNVDVVSTIDLRAMAIFHHQHNSVATLAVQSRPTSRPLLVNDQGQLIARASSRDTTATRAKSSGDEAPFSGSTSPSDEPRANRDSAVAFAGIHVLSPTILPLLTESGAFPIIDAYLRLSAAGHKILAFPADQYRWRDLGRPADLSAAALDLEQ